MKTAFGFITTAILFSLFIAFITLASDETKHVKGFHEVLDEKINIEETNLPQTSYIKDRNGQIAAELYKDMNRIYISQEQIPAFMKELFIHAEDKNFYSHKGFDLAAIGRALTVNIKAKEIEEGASTITQQLARNLYLSHEKSYNRKLSEILYAYQLERLYSKDEILELYLNTIYFHNGAYGVEAAANTYFQKKASELTKGEQAFLAAIPNNPSLYNPLKHFDRTKKRQERLIDLMAKEGYLNGEEAEQIKNEPIALKTKKKINKHPDFTTYVEAELKELIARAEGYEKQINEAGSKEEKTLLKEKLNKRTEELIRSGIVIETSLDPYIQDIAKEAVKKYLPYKSIEGAAVAIDHRRNEIIALTGGKNYKKYDFHRGFQAYRQPGSAIKPLLDYAPYIERTNASLSEKISAGDFCANGYCPKNYGGATYGMVTLEQAFIRSYNTPAIRLLHKTGIENGFSDLKKFQFKKLVKDDYRLPAAIGGFTYGMTPLELTDAYTVFANYGSYRPARAIRQVTDLSGNVLYKWEEKPVPVWNENTVQKMRTLLHKTVVSGTGRKAYFQSGYIGGKTGTTNDWHDLWFVGLTEHITAGVWVGKDNPSNIRSVESAAPQMAIWKEIARNASKINQ